MKKSQLQHIQYTHIHTQTSTSSHRLCIYGGSLPTGACNIGSDQSVHPDIPPTSPEGSRVLREGEIPLPGNTSERKETDEHVNGWIEHIHPQREKERERARERDYLHNIVYLSVGWKQNVPDLGKKAPGEEEKRRDDTNNHSNWSRRAKETRKRGVRMYLCVF